MIHVWRRRRPRPEPVLYDADDATWGHTPIGSGTVTMMMVYDDDDQPLRWWERLLRRRRPTVILGPGVEVRREAEGIGGLVLDGPPVGDGFTITLHSDGHVTVDDS